MPSTTSGTNTISASRNHGLTKASAANTTASTIIAQSSLVRISVIMRQFHAEKGRVTSCRRDDYGGPPGAYVPRMASKHFSVTRAGDGSRRIKIHSRGRDVLDN